MNVQYDIYNGIKIDIILTCNVICVPQIIALLFSQASVEQKNFKELTISATDFPEILITR